jgi:hypothetical protein
MVTETMSLKQVLAPALGLLFVLIAAACQPAPAAPADRETERYAVYSAVIDDVGGLPVLNDRAGGRSWRDSDYERVHDEIDAVDQALWDDLGQVNDHAELLEQRFDAGLGEVLLAHSADLGVLFSKNKPADAWEIFHQKFPGKCLLGVSNVGFNDQMDKAILYASGSCDETSGSGRIVYLAKQRGKWSVQGKVTLWGM